MLNINTNITQYHIIRNSTVAVNELKNKTNLNFTSFHVAS